MDFLEALAFTTEKQELTHDHSDPEETTPESSTPPLAREGNFETIETWLEHEQALGVDSQEVLDGLINLTQFTRITYLPSLHDGMEALQRGAGLVAMPNEHDVDLYIPVLLQDPVFNAEDGDAVSRMALDAHEKKRKRVSDQKQQATEMQGASKVARGRKPYR